MIIDGKKIAADIYGELAKRCAGQARAPRLGILVATKDPVIESFVRIKSHAAARLNVELVRVDLLEGSTQEAITAVKNLSAKSDGIIVQLPLPDGFDIDAILSAIPSTHDVDGINPTISYTDQKVHAPVAEAVKHIFDIHHIDANGKIAVVVGAGRLVGAPVAALLRELGAEVSMVTLSRGSLEELKTADIVVLGAGDPGFIEPEMIKDGVVLIDAGTSEQGGKIQGDADPACADKCSLFTPVPGGIGPIAVSMIFKNLFDLVEK